MSMWCEHCRGHYNGDHYDPDDGYHRAGQEYGSHGALLAAEQIVRALAAEQYPGCLGSCRFCDQHYDPLDLDGAGWHLPECPWRRAMEWVDVTPLDSS